jgi:hypothetical protein
MIARRGFKLCVACLVGTIVLGGAGLAMAAAKL